MYRGHSDRIQSEAGNESGTFHADSSAQLSAQVIPLSICKVSIVAEQDVNVRYAAIRSHSLHHFRPSLPDGTITSSPTFHSPASSLKDTPS